MFASHASRGVPRGGAGPGAKSTTGRLHAETHSLVAVMEHSAREGQRRQDGLEQRARAGLIGGSESLLNPVGGGRTPLPTPSHPQAGMKRKHLFMTFLRVFVLILETSSVFAGIFVLF